MTDVSNRSHPRHSREGGNPATLGFFNETVTSPTISTIRELRPLSLSKGAKRSKGSNDGATGRATTRWPHILTAMTAALILAGCSLAPKYERPVVATPAAFKEAAAADNTQWKTATPAEAQARGEWWKLFGDATLDALSQGHSPEYAVTHCHAALDALADLTGETTPEDVLARLFSTFCVGK